MLRSALYIVRCPYVLRVLVSQVASGMAYLHSANIIHAGRRAQRCAFEYLKLSYGLRLASPITLAASPHTHSMRVSPQTSRLPTCYSSSSPAAAACRCVCVMTHPSGADLVSTQLPQGLACPICPMHRHLHRHHSDSCPAS